MQAIAGPKAGSKALDAPNSQLILRIIHERAGCWGRQNPKYATGTTGL